MRSTIFYQPEDFMDVRACMRDTRAIGEPGFDSYFLSSLKFK